MSAVRVEINGSPATAEQLAAAMLQNYGHFSTMRVEARAVRGLDLHLQRLDDGSRRLFGRPLPAETLRPLMRQALQHCDGAASMRVNVFAAGFDREQPERSVPLDVMISVGPAPRSSSSSPVRVQLQAYERELPQVKHVATFGLLYQRRLARIAGYDDALFIDRQGRISEGSVWNIGFWDGARVTWPQAAMLDGVSMRLLQQGLQRAGVPSETRELRVKDLPAFRAAFYCNANRSGVPIIAIDEQRFSEDVVLSQLLAAADASAPWEGI